MEVFDRMDGRRGGPTYRVYVVNRQLDHMELFVESSGFMKARQESRSNINHYPAFLGLPCNEKFSSVELLQTSTGSREPSSSDILLRNQEQQLYNFISKRTESISTSYK